MLVEFFKTIGAGFASIIIVVVFILVLWLVLRYHFRRRGRTVRIEASPTSDADKAVTGILLEALRTAFANFSRGIALLEGRIALRDSGLSYFTDCAHVLPSAEKVDIQVELEKVKIGNLAPFISRYIGKKDFILQISVKSKPASGYSVFASLLMHGKLWHTWNHEGHIGEVNDYCQGLIREVVCATSCNTKEEAQLVGHWKQHELYLLEGLEHFSAYLQRPTDATLLKKVVEIFEKARHGPWGYQVELLRIIAMMRAQNKPEEVLQRMQELREKYGKLRQRDPVLQYNLAVANFRMYDRGGDYKHYDKAIELFKSIKRPRLPILGTTKKFSLTLYLLAQAGISNCYAHKLNKSTKKEKKEIINKIQAINEETIGLVQRFRDILGPSADEVEWRIYNAYSVTALFGQLDVKKGIEAVNKGLFIDPANLPLKANLGSLILLKAKQAEQYGDVNERNGSIKEAEEIFLELDETKWDPGFVKYRLGRIRRLQGNFGKAIDYLKEAKKPEVRDVSNKLINEEIKKAQEEDSRF